MILLHKLNFKDTVESQERMMMAQTIFNVSGLEFGTYALIPQYTKYSQVSRKILGHKNEGRVFGLYKGIEQTFVSSYLIQNWNSICVNVDTEDSIPVKIYLNGALQETTSEVAVVYLFNINTKLFISSDSMWNSFIGSVTDLNIWNSTLSDEDIQSFSNCSLTSGQNKVFDWNQAELIGIENIDVTTIDTEDICKTETDYIYIASDDKKDFFDSLDYCSEILGGSMGVIENETVINKMTEVFESLPDWESKCFVRFWTGYIKHNGEELYKDPITEQPIHNIEWMPDEPRNLDTNKSCPMYDTSTKASLNKECLHLKCPICRVPVFKRYILRGVCIDQTWLADTYYYLKQEKLFMGNIHSKIEWRNTRWEIQRLHDNSTIAFMNETTNYPFGIHKWYFEESKCYDEGESWRTLILHQEVEQPGKFCCDDGVCIDSDLVCDENQHCEDNSDERNCNMIELKDNYNSQRAPSQRIKRNKKIEFTETTVSFSVYIHYLMEINHDDATFSILFMASNTWTDQRLSFNFLKNGKDKNGIAQNHSSVWIPKFTYSITHELEKVNYDLFVTRKQKPLLKGGLDLLHPKGSLYYIIL